MVRNRIALALVVVLTLVGSAVSAKGIDVSKRTTIAKGIDVSK